MKHRSNVQVASLLLVPALLIIPFTYLSAQDKVAAFKQALANNQKQLRQYQWIETTTISMKGEVKSQIQKQCFYGPDGKVQKYQISASPEQQMPGGIKGKVAAKKKAEAQDYMERAVFWVQQYVPPESQRIQAAKDAGRISANPMGQVTLVLAIRDYLKMGDTLTLNLNTATMAMQGIKVNTYMDSPDDKVNLDVGFASLSDSVEYPAKIVLDAPAKQIQVVMQNANYQMIAPAAAQVTSMQVPPQAQSMAAVPSPQQGPPMSPQQINPLTAPIALYPDALVGQILEASTNIPQLQSFAGWMSKNATLHGDALQAAASKAGFAPCYVALAPFSSVVQMMVQKLDWTTKLGQAFTTNRAAVFDSIQRLRADAAKAGTLKTNQQQTVTTQTTSSGDTVIVVQPTNPQVVYVPTYNPQTVYVQDNSNEAAAAAMGFTAGVIITAAASNNYYYGPYAWRGGYAYNEAWDNRYQYAEQRQDTYQNNSQYRQDQYSQNSQQRQSTQQANQDYRQTTQQTNQSERQTQQQTNQDTRQSTQQTNQSERQSTQQANQSERQGNQSSRQSTAQTNQSTRQSNAQSSASTAQGNAQANRASRQSSASSAQGNAQANQSSRQSSASSAQSSRASTSSFGSGQSSGQRSGMSSGGFSGGGYQSGSTTRSQSSRGSSSLSSSRSGGSRSGGSRSGGGGRR